MPKTNEIQNSAKIKTLLCRSANKRFTVVFIGALNIVSFTLSAILWDGFMPGS